MGVKDTVEGGEQEPQYPRWQRDRYECQGLMHINYILDFF